MTRTNPRARGAPVATLPRALDHLDAVAAHLRSGTAAIFLDYDGTLTPIVERPEDAVLSERARATVRALAEDHVVAIVSGRALADVRGRVGLEGVYYAGCHGFEIEGPSGALEHEGARAAKPQLELARARLEPWLAGVEGAQLEPKELALAVHVRRVAPAKRPDVEAAVRALARELDALEATEGKMVFELRPAVPWDKGRAVRWLLEEIFASPSEAAPLYVGDDRTDEDAFRELASDGVAVLVGDHGGLTHAGYRLADVPETLAWLDALGRALRAPS